MKYYDTHSILFRIKVGGRNVLLIQILRNTGINRKWQKYDSFFVKFETTPQTMPPCYPYTLKLTIDKDKSET